MNLLINSNCLSYKKCNKNNASSNIVIFRFKINMNIFKNRNLALFWRRILGKNLLRDFL